MIFIAALLGLIYEFAGTPGYLIAWGGWMVAFAAYVTVESVLVAREIKRIRAENALDDPPNDTALRAGWSALAEKVGDRVYRSKATLLGLALIDVNLSAVRPPVAGDSSGSSASRQSAPGRSWLDCDRRRRSRRGARDRLDRPRLGRARRPCLGRGEFRRSGPRARRIRGVGVRRARNWWARRGRLRLGWCRGWLAGSRRAGRRLGHRLRRRSIRPACSGWRGSHRPRLCNRRRGARARHANDEAARAVLLEHEFTRFAFTVLGQRHVLEQLTGAEANLGQAADREPPAAAGQPALDNGLTVRIRPIRGSHGRGAGDAIQDRRRSRPGRAIRACSHGGTSLRHRGCRRRARAPPTPSSSVTAPAVTRKPAIATL